MSRSSNFSNTRLYVIIGFFVLTVCIIMYQLFNLQIRNGHMYAEMVDSQHVSTAANIFDRGNIFFTKKDGNLVSAATMNTGFTLVINPQKISDADEAYQALSTVIDIDYDFFIDRAGRVRTVHQEIAHKLREDTAQELRALQLPFVQVLRDRWRAYPGNELASHAIGFVGFGAEQSTVLSGQYGIERYYDEVLSRNRQGMNINAFAEIFSNIQNIVSEDTSMQGDVIMTIEPSVQAFLETTIQKISEDWNAQETGAIIIHPQTGALYALGKTPSFDLNNFRSVSSPSVYRNTFVENVFEMGSIIKPLIMAIGLELDIISANMPFYDPGSVQVGNRTIFNFDRRGRGDITMQDVLNQSLNTGMVEISQLVPRNDFYEYMMSFGFGERTGVDLPFETTGLISNLETKRNVEYANISFGQGIAVTPMSMVRALSALGNGGYLITPHLVSEIRRPGSLPKKIRHEKGDQVFSEKTSDEITRMLVEVVDESLMDGRAKLDYYSVAAKTGTAQIPSPDGGYYTDRNLHSFFGYFPAYDPEFLIFLYTIHPKGARFASQTLAPPFFDMTRFLINYYNVTPDRAPLPSSE